VVEYGTRSFFLSSRDSREVEIEIVEIEIEIEMGGGRAVR
jgi:hypothetical protein